MKALVICDIDGCLNSGKASPLDLEALASIRIAVSQLHQRDTGFTLCTGRPQPYAEAFAALLDVRLPLVCENGGLIYDRTTDTTTALVSADTATGLDSLKRDLGTLPGFGSELFFEPGKVVSASITGPKVVNADHAALSALTKELAVQFASHPFQWTHSTTAIDVTPLGTDKASGVKALLQRVAPGDVPTIGIGDTAGDIPFLKQCNRVLVPFNASSAVQQLSEYISEDAYALGTFDILETIIKGYPIQSRKQRS